MFGRRASKVGEAVGCGAPSRWPSPRSARVAAVCGASAAEGLDSVRRNYQRNAKADDVQLVLVPRRGSRVCAPARRRRRADF